MAADAGNQLGVLLLDQLIDLAHASRQSAQPGWRVRRLCHVLPALDWGLIWQL